MSIDLEKMSLAELKGLRKQVEAAINSFEARKIEAALAEVKEVAKKHGVDIADLTGGKKAGKKPSVAKYRDPADASNTWSGRGRKPNWLVQALNDGKDIEEFAI